MVESKMAAMDARAPKTVWLNENKSEHFTPDLS